MKAKHERKDYLKKKEKKKIKLLAAKTTTYIEVNAPSTNHIQIFLFGAIVYSRANSNVKDENAKNIGWTLVKIILEQKQNVK